MYWAVGSFGVLLLLSYLVTRNWTAIPWGVVLVAFAAVMLSRAATRRHQP